MQKKSNLDAEAGREPWISEDYQNGYLHNPTIVHRNGQELAHRLPPTNPALRSHPMNHASETPRSEHQARFPNRTTPARKHEHKKRSSSTQRNTMRNGRCDGRSGTLAVGGRGGGEQESREQQGSQQRPRRHRHPNRLPAKHARRRYKRDLEARACARASTAWSGVG
jgi:hypothetical protein